MTGKLLSCVALATLLSACATVAGSSIDFGDDTSAYAMDGECDDKRFEGAGMTTTPLLDDDIGRDASDCQAAFEAGTITFVGGEIPPSALVPADFTGRADGVNYGDNSGGYPNDNECDDPRFEGSGVAWSPSRDNIGRDAADCRIAVLEGNATYTGELEPLFAGTADGVDYGDNSGFYPDDGECDDPRFAGEDVAGGASRDNVRGDAHDCRQAVTAGTARYTGELAPLFVGVFEGVDMGDNEGGFPDDGECDDPRFSGENVAAGASRDNVRRDAHDCHAALVAGTARYDGELAPLFTGIFRGVDFGLNEGYWVEDGDCDDPRFRGPGMTTPSYDRDAIGNDAADCKEMFEKGFVRVAVSEPPFEGVFRGINMGDNSGGFALDGECDDPRFEGPGMGVGDDSVLARTDASDCKILLEEGAIRLKD